MNFVFKNEIIDYNYSPGNKPTVIFLHGWGGNKNSFSSTVNLLKSNYSILTLTMPTINNTSVSWNMFDYCSLIESLCKLHNIKSAYVICHSFGFRVATLLKNKINIKKIVVTGGAGMKKQNVIKKIETSNNKILLKNKRYNSLFNHIASKDYVSLSDINKSTFKQIVNFVTNKLVKFKCPMLLFWGKRDTETPVWIAKKIKKENDAKLILTNDDHFAYLKQTALFNKEVLRFLK